MAASFETLHLQPPIPPTPKPTNSISIPLSADVLTEVLLWLPAKSLMRFKSVCKKWLSLISSDYFSRQHTLLRHPKSQPSLILQHSVHGSDPDHFYWSPTLSMNGGEKVMIPYTLSVSRGYKIVQACNGLLLLNCGRDSYRVYNPTTKLSTEINIPTYNDKHEYIAAVAIAFNPSKSPYYKIVCICSAKRGVDTCRIEVYDSESCSWKLSFEPFTRPSVFLYSAQYWNNAIYWWRPNKSAYYCFDIAKNEMKALFFPQSHDFGVVCDSYFQELDGRLYYLTLSFGEPSESRKLVVAVWELGGDDEWLLKHDRVFACEGIGEFVQLMGGADENLVVVFHNLSGKMKAYSFLHKSCEELVDFTAPPFGYKYHNASHYTYDGYNYVYAYYLKAFQFGETLALV